MSSVLSLNHSVPSLPGDGPTELRLGALPPVPAPGERAGMPILRPTRHPFIAGGELEGFDPADTCTRCLLGQLAHDYLDGRA